MTFKVGDKVASTEAHDKHFGYNLKGIVERINSGYFDVFTQRKTLVTLHSKWMQPFNGELLFIYKVKLV